MNEDTRTCVYCEYFKAARNEDMPGMSPRYLVREEDVRQYDNIDELLEEAGAPRIAQMGEPPERLPIQGFCRRHAPVSEGWPAVCGDDWCGEFR